MTKIKAPNGWLIVKWKDKCGKKWVNTIPKSYLKHMKTRCKKLNCKIIKIWR